MQEKGVLRLFFFLLFFTVGAGALGLSILVEDLTGYYSNKQYLKTSEEAIERLKLLNEEYDTLLNHLEEDPNLLDRIVPMVLGVPPDANENMIYPKMKARQLEAAVKVLENESGQVQADEQVPIWLVRAQESRKRIILFLCGACLILVSFACFGPVKDNNKNQGYQPD
ncbi:MAG: hypothetical protein ACYTBP_11235 [Planctomycetota bacterium]